MSHDYIKKLKSYNGFIPCKSKFEQETRGINKADRTKNYKIIYATNIIPGEYNFLRCGASKNYA